MHSSFMCLLVLQGTDPSHEGGEAGRDIMADELQEQEEAARLIESRRPEGISKIDLRDVWGGRTPATSQEEATG